MNIFILNECEVISAEEQCDKHVVKMPLESAQMLSTAHRVLDGNEIRKPSKSGKTMVKYFELPSDRESILYKAVHINHPCSVWARESDSNYNWLYKHFIALSLEYKYRYDKDHGSYLKLAKSLKSPPNNIPKGGLTPFKLAMGSNPECMFPEDPIKSYRLYYKTKQDRFKMVWTKREVPGWFTNANV